MLVRIQLTHHAWEAGIYVWKPSILVVISLILWDADCIRACQLDHISLYQSCLSAFCMCTPLNDNQRMCNLHSVPWGSCSTLPAATACVVTAITEPFAEVAWLPPFAIENVVD